MIGATNGRKSKKGRVHGSNGDIYTEEEVEFIRAVDKFRREHNTPFLAATEYLEIAKSLGYRKVE